MLLYSNPKSPFCLCSLFLKCSASVETKGSKVCVGLSILICCLPKWPVRLKSPLFLFPLRWRLRQILLYLYLGMCLKKNYPVSLSNEYLRQYSAESKSEYLRRQIMNSKLGEEQKKKEKKDHHVRGSPNFNSNSDKKQKKG